MKKIIALILCLVLALSLVGFLSVVHTEKKQEAAIENHPSGFDGDTLYINVNGEILAYERFEPGIGSLTQKAILDTFDTETEVEGIVWEVYSVEEYPDLSYVLAISGTNSSWTYHMI